MILNHAADIQRENIPTDFVYHGNVLVWCRTRIAIIPASGGTMIYFNNFSDAYQFLHDHTGTLYNVIIVRSRSIPAWAFASMYNLNAAFLPDGVTGIGEYAFRGCTALSRINIPDSVNTLGKNAFDYCKGLENIVISGGIETLQEQTFYNCQNLKYVTMQSGLKYIGEKTFSACHALESVTFPDTLLEIGSRAFAHCYVLDNIVIPTSVTAIASDAFYDDTAFITITIQKPENSISGAPWGARNATVIWTG